MDDSISAWLAQAKDEGDSAAHPSDWSRVCENPDQSVDAERTEERAQMDEWNINHLRALRLHKKGYFTVLSEHHDRVCDIFAMGVAFDYAEGRPEHIEAILNGLDRYNPETTATFQDYVQYQCENQTYDSYANLALLKLYQFNPDRARDVTITNILVKALTQAPSADFSLCLALLPPYTLAPVGTTRASNPAAGDTPLPEAVQKLNNLNNLLGAADYSSFWDTLNGDDDIADLCADVIGFEDTVRVKIAAAVSQTFREIQRPVLESWMNHKGRDFEKFVTDVCGFRIEGDNVLVPPNKDNEAKGTVIRENVKFDQFSRIIRRAYEQPA